MKADKKLKQMLLELWNIYKDSSGTIQDWYGYYADMINKLIDILDYVEVEYNND